MRKGIIAAGNWIIDYVKIIDKLPDRNMLANIKSEMRSIGGAPHNVLVDLAKLQVSIPLAAAGVIGNDADGDYILDQLKQHQIDIAHMQKISDKSTSYTDVMTEEDTGFRTFFHYRGANALLDNTHFVGIDTDHKIFHLGYLLLLDKLDAEDEQYGVVAARVLDSLQQKGYKTSVDVVSEQSDRFRRIVTPCLQYVDYLIVNEVEAGETTNLKIRKEDDSIDADNLVKAAQALLDGGVKELVVIHFPEGGYAMNKKGARIFVPSFLVQQDEIVGTVGAGDAFCAGVLYGLHEEFPLEKTLTIANASARFNLTHATTTGGATSIQEVEEYIKNATQRADLQM